MKGALKTGRKGVSRYQVEVTGRAAHAGLDPERGANAGLELAELALRVEALGNGHPETTVTPTTMTAGRRRTRYPMPPGWTSTCASAMPTSRAVSTSRCDPCALGVRAPACASRGGRTDLPCRRVPRWSC
ncbi:MAG: peptidase dimerization domain-containing protein [Nocardioidaceae bacterium]|nr:peptidase dimerization domain-containing protein [Nocardioidaceae bacterium]